MSWQLWVVIATAAAGIAALVVARFHHAQQVFDRIIGQLDESRTDEVARQRRRHRTALVPRVAHHRSGRHH